MCTSTRSSFRTSPSTDGRSTARRSPSRHDVREGPRGRRARCPHHRRLPTRQREVARGSRSGRREELGERGRKPGRRVGGCSTRLAYRCVLGPRSTRPRVPRGRTSAERARRAGQPPPLSRANSAGCAAHRRGFTAPVHQSWHFSAEQLPLPPGYKSGGAPYAAGLSADSPGKRCPGSSSGTRSDPHVAKPCLEEPDA